MFVIGALLGAGVAYMYGAGSYQRGFDAAKKLVADSPMGAMFFSSPADIMSISGTVTAVNGNSITIKTQSTNPFDDPALLDRTITVNKDTKIVKVTMPDPKEMQAQMEAFTKAMKSGKAPATPPALPQPKETTIEVSAITVGDTLTATSAENIKTAKTFTATEIKTQQNLSTLAPLPVTTPVK
jgi:hypothetical protein